MVLVVSGMIFLLSASTACGQQGRLAGFAFSLGYESYPGELFYKLTGIRYVNGVPVASRSNPKADDATFVVLSFRVKKMVPTKLRKLSVGAEAGMSVPVSGHEKPWDLPALTPKFSGDIYYPSFC